MRSFRLPVHQVKKPKTISQKLTKARDEKKRSKQSRGDRVTEWRALEKIPALLSACVDVGCVNVGGERQNTLTLSVWSSKEEEVGEVKQNWEEVEEVGFSLLRRG